MDRLGTPATRPDAHARRATDPASIWPVEMRPSEALASGAIPYQLRDGVPHVVLVTTRAQKPQWIVPKGKASRSYSGPTSASKEAYEEAGVLGRIDPRVAAIDHVASRNGGLVSVHYFHLSVRQVLNSWPEMKQRQRRILPAEEAAKLLANPVLREAILRLADEPPKA